MSAATSHSTKGAAATTQEPIKGEYDDAEKNYQLKSPKFWTIIVGMYLSFLLVALDRTIIASAIPRITDEFDSIKDIGWYGTAYMLTAACFFPISGRVYQLYSTKWVFLLSIVIFEVGSALCGGAPSSTAFIIGRAIAGLGGAGIFSGGIMITLPLIPLRKRPMFMSTFGLAAGVASVLGPIIGGLLTDHVTWRWCFYINLPIGGCTMLAVLLFLHIESPTRDKLTIVAQIKRFDPLGIFFFIPSMVCLVLALQWGGSTLSWSAPRIIGLLVAFAILFAAFIAVEVLMPETAMAPTRVVFNRSVAGAMSFMFLLYGGLMSALYYLTVWFQAAKGDSATGSGVNTIPIVLGFIVIGIVSAACAQKIGYYTPIMLLAPIFCSIGAGMLSTLKPSSGHSAWIGYQVLFGIGIGCGFQNANLAVQNTLPRSDVPIGIALVFFMQQLGGAVFLAVSQNVFSSSLVHRLAGITDLDPYSIVNTGATDLRTLVPTTELQVVVNAYSHALTRVFVLVAIISACMMLSVAVIEWKRLPRKPDTKETGQPAKEDPEACQEKEDISAKK